MRRALWVFVFLLAGCSGDKDEGAAAAGAACDIVRSAVEEARSGANSTARLVDAEQEARKAADASGEWEPLADAIQRLRTTGATESGGLESVYAACP